MQDEYSGRRWNMFKMQKSSAIGLIVLFFSIFFVSISFADMYGGNYKATISQGILAGNLIDNNYLLNVFSQYTAGEISDNNFKLILAMSSYVEPQRHQARIIIYEPINKSYTIEPFPLLDFELNGTELNYTCDMTINSVTLNIGQIKNATRNVYSFISTTGFNQFSLTCYNSTSITANINYSLFFDKKGGGTGTIGGVITSRVVAIAECGNHVCESGELSYCPADCKLTNISLSPTNKRFIAYKDELHTEKLILKNYGHENMSVNLDLSCTKDTFCYFIINEQTLSSMSTSLNIGAGEEREILLNVVQKNDNLLNKIDVTVTSGNYSFVNTYMSELGQTNQFSTYMIIFIAFIIVTSLIFLLRSQSSRRRIHRYYQ